MGSKVSKPVNAPSASANTGAGTGLTQLAASAPPSVAPAAPSSVAAPSVTPAALETISEVTNAQQIQRGSRIRVLKDSRTRARMRRNRNHRSHRRQRNRHGSRSRK